MTSGDIARTGLDAWEQLGQCGLEVNGRDADFAEAIRNRVDDRAGTLEEALEGCSSEQFVRAFLATAEPYVKMLKGILRMFEMAGIKQGEDHWRVAFDDYEASVEHFKQWERVFDSIGWYVEVHDLTQQDWGRLVETARSSFVTGRKGDSGAFWDTLKPKSGIVPTLHAEPWMRDLWVLISRVEQLLSEAGLDLVTARQNIQWGEPNQEKTDGFAVDFLRKFQHDYQISQLIAAYEVFSSSPEARQEVDGAIAELLAAVPRRKFWSEASVDELKPFLQLPIWQMRHEFYAAWVAAEQIAVFRDSGIDVHSEGGKITFPFRETRVATLRSGAWSLISERRTPLDAPSGAGRKENVPPDYGWWQKGAGSQEHCALVVEVKHYKKAGGQSWVHVLEDYARAHANAEILLVNYGRGGRADERVEEALSRRCRIIGELHPNSPVALKEFREAVARILAPSKRRARNAIVLDVSSSMRLKKRKLRAPLQKIADEFDCEEVFAVDDEIVSSSNVGTLQDDEIQAFSRNRAESLGNPISAILDAYEAIWLISDLMGVQSVQVDPRFGTVLHNLSAPDPDLMLVEVRRS